jgi:hypothetical protein
MTPMMNNTHTHTHPHVLLPVRHTALDIGIVINTVGMRVLPFIREALVPACLMGVCVMV